MPDAVDVFLCHSGQDPLVKQLLDFVRRALHEVPPLGGSVPVCVSVMRTISTAWAIYRLLWKRPSDWHPSVRWRCTVSMFAATPSFILPMHRSACLPVNFPARRSGEARFVVLT